MKPAAIDPPEVWPALWKGLSGTVGWDIGANCGQTLPVMLQKFEFVVAFEPADECWPYLDQFIQPTGEFSWHPFALSDKDADVELLALPDKIDTGQLVTAGTYGMEWDPDQPGAQARTVQARSVDGLLHDGTLTAPDFLKIDVEGHELKVLFGAKRTLAVVRPDLLVEFHSRDLHHSVRELLEGYGYQVSTIRHPHYRPGTELWMSHGWMRATQ